MGITRRLEGEIHKDPRGSKAVSVADTMHLAAADTALLLFTLRAKMVSKLGPRRIKNTAYQCLNLLLVNFEECIINSH